VARKRAFPDSDALAGTRDREGSVPLVAVQSRTRALFSTLIMRDDRACRG
jgi:hypothetical protein